MSGYSLEVKLASAVAVGAISVSAVLVSLLLKSIFALPVKHVENVPSKCTTELGHKEPLTVYVFDGPGAGISGSQFSTKLVMFLRLAGIPHRVMLAEYEKAPKNKIPYIEHDGAKFGDTQLILRYLENSFDVPRMASDCAKDNGGKAFVPFQQLSPVDQALSDMIRLTCEGEIYWAVGGIRWGGKFGIGKSEKHWVVLREKYFQAIPSFIRNMVTTMIRATVLKDAWGYGLARHSPDDQLYLGCRALKSLSNFLGQKPFFLGDFLSECDCAAFGSIESALEDELWPSPLSVYVREECPNLVSYVARVRSLVFPDVAPSDLRPHSKETGTPYPRK